MKHTQGDWKHIIEKDGMNINDVIKNNNQYIATIHVTGSDEEWNANAKLIAAAPDLLEACIQMSANVDKWLKSGESATPEQSERLHNLMKAAIKKATV